MVPSFRVRAPLLDGVVRLLLASLLALPTAGQAEAEAPDAAPGAPRPNIVVILTDDLAYSGLGCYGSEVSTPRIDRLAQGGLRFRRCYNGGRCSPTRASLLTGHDPHTVGVSELAMSYNETPLPAYRAHLDPFHPTLAELLREAGYYTLMCGKWHLGGTLRPLRERAKLPLERGFDHFFGILPGQTGKFEPDRGRPYVFGTEVYDTTQHPGGFYAETAFVDVAVQLLQWERERADRPFFLYLPFTAPHPPYDVAPERAARLAEVYRWERLPELRAERLRRMQALGAVPSGWKDNDEPYHRAFRSGLYESRPVRRNALEKDLARFAAMVELVDENVGRLVDALERWGELENTLVFVLSDNGAGGPPGEVFNAPFRGSKNKLVEGGVLTHLVAHWPAGLRRGGWTDQVAHVFDIAPTCLEVAGVRYPSSFRGKPTQPMEGISLAPHFAGAAAENRPYLMWDLYAQQSVIQDGRWKWISDELGRESLYDLERDGTETTNLVAQHPERVRALREAHRSYRRRMGVLPLHTVLAWKRMGTMSVTENLAWVWAMRLTHAETRPRTLLEMAVYAAARLGALTFQRR